MSSGKTGAYAHGTYPINHLCVNVTDIDTAVQWYIDNLGFKILQPITTKDRDATPDKPIFSIFPPSLKRCRMAYMSTGNSVGFKLHEILDPKPKPEDAMDFEKKYWHGGVLYVAITTPDVQATIERIEKAGGKQVGDTITVFGSKAAYVQDPWGNIMELNDMSFELLLGNRQPNVYL